jgi:uncharacterized protein (TIGR00369 family)
VAVSERPAAGGIHMLYSGFGMATYTKKTKQKQDPGIAAGNNRAPAGSTRNYCFGCGGDNPEGLGLKFAFDEERNSFVCRLKLSRRHTGPPGHAHGGIIATILDEAMGKANRITQVTAVTKKMTVEYCRLVPLGKPLIAEGWQRGGSGRVHVNVAELRSAEGEILARSEGTFIAIDPQKMFRGHIKGR